MMLDGAVIVLERAFLQFGLVAAQPVNKRFLDRVEIGAGFPEFLGFLAVRKVPEIIKSADPDFVLDGLQLKA